MKQEREMMVEIPGTLPPPGPDSGEPRPRVVLVSRRGRFEEWVMDRALSLAERVPGGLMAVYVDPMPQAGPGRGSQERFAAMATKNSEIFQGKAGRLGVDFSRLIMAGRMSEALAAVLRSTRRVKFVLLEPGLPSDELAAGLSVPVFGLVRDPEGGPASESSWEMETQPAMVEGPRGGYGNSMRPEGGMMMATSDKNRNLKRSLLFGAMAVGLYALVFSMGDSFAALCARGGWYAVVPVATVFAFSFVHGNFTSSFWSALGIEASKTILVRKTAQPTVRRRDTRPRATVNV